MMSNDAPIRRWEDEALEDAKVRIAELEEALRGVTTYILKCKVCDDCALCRARKVLKPITCPTCGRFGNSACSDIYHPMRQGYVYKNGVLQPHCRLCGKLKRDPERVVGIGLGEALEATDTAHFCAGHPEPLFLLME